VYKNFYKIKRPLCILPKYLYGNKKYGLSPEYNALYLPLKKKYKNIQFINSLESKNLRKLNIKIINYCKKNKPDYIFFSVYHYEIYLETLFFLKNNLNIFLVNWSSDDSWRFSQHSKILSNYFDCMITNSFLAKKFYKSNKINYIISSWGCPDSWYRKFSKNTKFDYDILFIGKSYFDRKKIITRLSKKYNVVCYGDGWGTRSLKDYEMPENFRKAKISLNFSKSRGHFKQVKARIFEIIGSGGFCLTENSNELNLFFNSSEVDSFNNFSELIFKIELYLKNYRLRNKLAYNANTKVKKKYLYSNIINEIVSKIIKIKKSRITNKIPNVNKLFYLIIFYLSKFYKSLSVILLSLFFQEKKAYKISRRLLFEIEWRLRGQLTYTKHGLSNKLYDVYY
jgi:spore maturation protein CgeB